MKTMTRFSKSVVLNRKREDIIRWYEALEISYDKELSKEQLIDNLYNVLQTNFTNVFNVKQKNKPLSKQELKWLDRFFDAKLKYSPGPLYMLTGTLMQKEKRSK